MRERRSPCVMFGIRTHEVMRVAACAGSASDSDRAAFYCSGTDGGAESEAFCGKAAGRSLPHSGSRAERPKGMSDVRRGIGRYRRRRVPGLPEGRK